MPPNALRQNGKNFVENGPAALLSSNHGKVAFLFARRNRIQYQASEGLKVQILSRVGEKKVPLATYQADLSDTPNVQNLKSVDQTLETAVSNQKVQNPKSVDQTLETAVSNQNVQNPKSVDQTPETVVSNQKVQNPKSVDQTPETAVSNQKVQNLKSVDQTPEIEALDQKVRNSEFVDQKPSSPQNQDLRPKFQDLRPKSQDPAWTNLPISKSVDQKTLARFESLRTQILERKELIACGGSLIETWRNHHGKRLGPYYQVAFRENRVLRTLYIGRDELLATMVSELIDELKNPLRQDRVLRQIRAAVKAGLRRSLAEAEALAAPLGYRRRGFSFHKQR